MEYGEIKRKNKELAGTGQRFLALFIDQIITGLAGGVLGGIGGFILGISMAPTTEAELLAVTQLAQSIGLVMGLIVQVLYYAYLPSQWDGKTVGKSAMNIRIVHQDGEPITFGMMFLRNVVGYFLSGIIIYLGFIWAFFDEENQTWHDKIAKTYVVRE